MVDRDAAFLWETEALRAHPAETAGPHEIGDRTDPDWLTLRQASEITGIPTPTLRKWALSGNVASYLEETPVGQLRMISRRGIYRRANELGREVRGTPQSQEAERPRPTSPRSEPPPELPPGTMLVPLDAWNKMLAQLGNLHEAGQQLAEARERAAKAETEARFLRDRLAELRGEMKSEPAESAEGTSSRRSISTAILRLLFPRNRSIR